MVIRRCLKLGVSRGSKGKVSRWGSQREREKEEEFPKSLFFNSQEDIAHINGLHYVSKQFLKGNHFHLDKMGIETEMFLLFFVVHHH